MRKPKMPKVKTKASLLRYEQKLKDYNEFLTIKARVEKKRDNMK